MQERCVEQQGERFEDECAVVSKARYTHSQIGTSGESVVRPKEIRDPLILNIHSYVVHILEVRPWPRKRCLHTHRIKSGRDLRPDCGSEVEEVDGPTDISYITPNTYKA